MRLFITGASGMVGRNLLADPRAGSHEILAPPRASLDFLDAGACRAAFADFRPESVIHLAAVVGGIQANIDEPVRFLADNVQIALNVMLAARAAGVGQLLNIASSCMYPRGIDQAMDPSRLLTGPFEPTNEGYALAKVVAWKLAHFMSRESPALAYRTIAPCNLYGPHDDFDPLRAHLVAAAIGKVVSAIESGAPEVEIWGDGTARREFLHVGDLVDFIWTWVERLGELPPILNVGAGHDHTVKEYYEAAARVAGFAGRFTYNLDRPVGMKRKLLDISAQTALGWRPRIDIESGMAMTMEHLLAAGRE